MAAPKKPLEFHAKRPWGPEEGGEDPDEDDEDDNEGAENGFSLEEVLRLGGTKVMALDSPEKGDRGARSGPSRGWANGPDAPELRRGWHPGPRTRLRNVFCALPALFVFHYSLQEKSSLELNRFMPWPLLGCR